MGVSPFRVGRRKYFPDGAALPDVAVPALLDGDPRVAPAGPETGSGAFSDLVTVKLDSCHSTWYFQPLRKRFRRELKGIGVAGVSTGWRPYHGVTFDDESHRFTVSLNREGTRLLSSWCHLTGSDACANCAEHEVSFTVVTAVGDDAV